MLRLHRRLMPRPPRALPALRPPCPRPADDPNLLRNRSLGDRTAVITAGVLANMALAFAICLLQVGAPPGGPRFLAGPQPALPCAAALFRLGNRAVAERACPSGSSSLRTPGMSASRTPAALGPPCRSVGRHRGHR